MPESQWGVLILSSGMTLRHPTTEGQFSVFLRLGIRPSGLLLDAIVNGCINVLLEKLIYFPFHRWINGEDLVL